MRAYFFGNMYLSSIQQGIQAKHCGDEMVVKYAPFSKNGEWCRDPTIQYNQLIDYLTNHKTVICLNAGYCETLHNIHKEMCDLDNPYPFAKFHESKEALDGALTSVGIVIPESIYETAAEVRSLRGYASRDVIREFNEMGTWRQPEHPHISYTFTKFQVWLINELNKYGLAK